MVKMASGGRSPYSGDAVRSTRAQRAAAGRGRHSHSRSKEGQTSRKQHMATARARFPPALSPAMQIFLAVLRAGMYSFFYDIVLFVYPCLVWFSIFMGLYLDGIIPLIVACIPLMLIAGSFEVVVIHFLAVEILSAGAGISNEQFIDEL